MRILCISYAYAPSVGGIESMSRTLCEEWLKMGHEVQIVTHTLNPDPDAEPILRRPSLGKLMELYRWCDVCWMHNISLHYAVPFLLSKKTILTAQGLPNDVGEPATISTRLKRYFYAHRVTIGVSDYMARSIKGTSKRIPNCFDNEDFTNEAPWSERERDVIVVARLYEGKGVAFAVRAIAELQSQGKEVNLTIVGYGPEEENLCKLASELGLGDQVHFEGTVSGKPLSKLINQHKLFLVPSTYGEPFGIVCLLGIACGCVVIGSDTGGIPDAIGSCGILVEKGDSTALAGAIGRSLEMKENPFAGLAGPHLARHTAEAVATEYLKVFQEQTSTPKSN
jgi:glycogen(starch) synthase